jgi:hypothetical protein
MANAAKDATAQHAKNGLSVRGVMVWDMTPAGKNALASQTTLASSWRGFWVDLLLSCCCF